MESWNSSNTDNRLSDNSDTTTNTKEIIVNDHQHYQIPTSNGSKLIFNFIFYIVFFLHSGDFLLKHQTNSNRSIVRISPPTNDRLRPISSVRPNVYDEKYDNYTKYRKGIDTITLVLKRDKRVLDFGFSISDRLYGTGVYVNKIRANGPAELEGTLIPCMRIYKVFFLIK